MTEPEATVRSRVSLPLRLGGLCTEAGVSTFDGLVDSGEHLALEFAGPSAGRRGDPEPLVRVHSECLTGDVFGSGRCDCGPQLQEAIERISTAGGILLYLRQEGRGIGLYAKLDAYALQAAGLDTYQANLALGYPEDAREYAVAAQMLRALGVERIRLLSNNPAKADQLEAAGISVVERVPTAVHLCAANERYLAAKAGHGAHTFELPGPDGAGDRAAS